MTNPITRLYYRRVLGPLWERQAAKWWRSAADLRTGTDLARGLGTRVATELKAEARARARYAESRAEACRRYR